MQDQGLCKRLGSTADQVEWNLIDEVDPTKGIKLTYLGGETCLSKNEKESGTERQFTINFKCSKTVSVPEFESLRVIEDDCRYSLDLETVLGCPNECLIGEDNRELCSNNGFCGMDRDNNAPRCFCFAGFGGSTCETFYSTSLFTGTGTFLLVLCIALVGLLVAGVRVYLNVTKLRRRQLYKLDAVEDEEHTVFSIDNDEY